MGYGGLLNTVADPFGIGSTDAPHPANPSAVGNDFRALLTQYINAQPQLLQTAQTYQPGYAALGTNTLNQVMPGAENAIGGANTFSRSADVGDYTNLGPAAGAAVGSVYNSLNPASGALLGKLTTTATQGLNAGSKLLPADMTRITSGVRSNWASRGLGASDPAQLDEAVNLATAGEGLRTSRQNFAQGVYGDNANVNATLMPAVNGLLTGQSAAPALGQTIAAGASANGVNPSAVYDMFNTAYNARTASNIAGANNAAANNSY